MKQHTLALVARTILLGSGQHQPKDIWEAKAFIAYLEGVHSESLVCSPSAYDVYIFPAALCVQCGNIVDFGEASKIPVDFVSGCSRCCRDDKILKESLLRRQDPGYLRAAAKMYFTEQEYRNLYEICYKIMLDIRSKRC